MDDKLKKNVGDLYALMSAAYKGMSLSAGISAGILERLNLDIPVAQDVLAKETGYDPDKLDKWLYFAELEGFIARKSNGIVLTDSGVLLTRNSPVKDLLGMLMGMDVLMKAASASTETFRIGKSLDKLSEGKISRDYQPKVSDNLSALMINYLYEHHIKADDSLLDIGCGNGSFLRLMNQSLPSVYLNGVDSNLFAIEMGKKENIQLGLQDKIKLLVGDVTTDMSDFPSNSYDWVTAINVFHFIPSQHRLKLSEEMIRIARKGVFMTETIIELTPSVAAVDPLMKLLWNDYSGFFRLKEVEELNRTLEQNFQNYKFQRIPILQGTSHLLIIQKHG